LHEKHLFEGHRRAPVTLVDGQKSANGVTVQEYLIGKRDS
jgi:hypothetical protein